MATAEDDSRRIVILGKTGSGKSSLANTIFGENDVFNVCHASTSGTMVNQSETRRVHGRHVQLIDTPGFFDTDPNAPELKKEILRCLIECSSGVHAFLLVLKVERFTKHEQSVSKLFCKHFSEEALNYTTVAFTQGDQLDEGVTIKKWIEDNKDLSTLVEKCGGRCHVFDNRYWKNSQDPYRSNQAQLKELLKTIDQTVEKNGERCYTNDILQMVQTDLKKQRRLIREAPRSVYMPQEVVDRKAKENTFTSLWPKLAHVLRVAFLFGLGVLGALVL